MVDLPKTPIKLITSEAPQTSLTPGQIASPYQQLGLALDKVGEGLNDVAEPLAERAGLQAVTKDANGNIQVEHAPIIGPAAKAYAHAVKYAALAQGEGDARRDDIELRNKHRDNPEAYRAAAGAYTDKIVKQYTDAAGPEVGMAMRRAIEGQTTQTYKGLLNEKQHLDLERAVESINSEIKTTQNQQYAMARGGVTSGPDFEAASGKIKALYAALGNNPQLAYPKEKIEYELSHYYSELKVQGLAHHIVDDVYPNQGLEAAAKATESISTDPGLNLAPGERLTLRGRIFAELSHRAMDDSRVQKGVAQSITNVEKMALQGYPVTPEQMGELRTQVTAVKVPELAQALGQTETIVSTMKQWRTTNPAQLEATLGTLDRTMQEQGATPIGLALKDAGEKLLKNMREGVKADPLGWAGRTGMMAVPPIGWGTKDAPGQMADRANRAEIIAQHYGIAPTYLRPDEKSSLEVAAAKGGDAMLGIARALVDGFGDRAPKVMAEISNDAPSLAHVGALMQSGGNAAFSIDVADAVKLRATPDAKKPHWVEKPPEQMIAAQEARVRDVYGQAFALSPNSGLASQRAAQDAFQTRAIRNGFDPALGAGRLLSGVGTKDTSEAAFDRSLQEAAGARFVGDAQYGGVSEYSKSGTFGSRKSNKVLVPGNVRADRFKDAIGAITDDDLSKMAISPVSASGKAYSASDIRSAVPIATKGGYRFAMGDPNSEDPKYIRGADGKPFVLDFGQMEERLRARVPGAFLGSK